MKIRKTRIAKSQICNLNDIITQATNTYLTKIESIKTLEYF